MTPKKVSYKLELSTELQKDFARAIFRNFLPHKVVNQNKLAELYNVYAYKVVEDRKFTKCK